MMINYIFIDDYHKKNKKKLIGQKNDDSQHTVFYVIKYN